MQACCNEDTTMERTPGTTIASLIAAAGLGALTMFFLDPLSGTRRTALARDRARHWMHEAADAAGTGWRDLRHRASGVAAGARHLVHREQVSDRVLEERVRAELGRWVSHPHAITVTAHDGHVLLGGAVLAAEHAHLTRAVAGVRGVQRVDSQVMAYEKPNGMPMLQGGIVRSGRRPSWPRGKRHAPATQLLGVSVGTALVAGGALQRGLPGLLLMAAGAAMAADVALTRRRVRDAARAVEPMQQQPGRAMQVGGAARVAQRGTRSRQHAPV
jgi:hypothetical protein